MLSPHLSLIRFPVLGVLLFVLAVYGCDGKNADDTPINLWFWISGADTSEQSGTYGTQGTSNSSNIPGARYDAVSWRDGDGDLWLFGGMGVDGLGENGFLNDLWLYQP